MLNKIVVNLVAVAAALFLAGQIYTFTALHSSIFVTYSVRLVSATLKPGEPLVVEFDFYRKRVCKTEVVRSILNDKNEIIFRSHSVAGASPVGRMSPPLRVHVDLPALPDGRYRFYNFTYSECSEGRHDFVDGPLEFFVKSE